MVGEGALGLRQKRPSFENGTSDRTSHGETSSHRSLTCLRILVDTGNSAYFNESQVAGEEPENVSLMIAEYGPNFRVKTAVKGNWADFLSRSSEGATASLLYAIAANVLSDWWTTVMDSTGGADVPSSPLLDVALCTCEAPP